jgi:acetoin utilization protein AcuB
MLRMKARHLPVVAGDGTLQGIVTDRDLRHYLFTAGVFQHIGQTSVQTILTGAPVKAIMSAPAVCVAPTADVEEAARLMRQRKIGSVPVVEGGRVVGILTETDMLRHIVRADERCSPEVEQIVVSYP